MRLMPPKRMTATRVARIRPITQWMTVMPLSVTGKNAEMAPVTEPVMELSLIFEILHGN